MNKNAIGLHKFSRIFRRGILQYFPHIPCRLQPKLRGNRRNASTLPSHAPCRLQRPLDPFAGRLALLCLHTLRADCNLRHFLHVAGVQALPPHAPCRLQLPSATRAFGTSRFASTRSVQIATRGRLPHHIGGYVLCLHTLRADCNGRNAQNCNIHFFRTCVELVDSFSVLNKSMLR